MLRLAFALGLIAGAAGSAAAEDRQIAHVVPFEVLESHPACTGPGKVAFQVAFDVKGAKARLGLAGQDKGGARACSITTRRGAELMEVAIPCPEVEAPDLAATKALDDLAQVADLSGVFVGCMGLTEVSLVEGSWTVRVETPQEVGIAQGDLTTPGLTLLFGGVQAQVNGGAGDQPRPQPPVLAVVLDEVALTLAERPGEAITLSSYVALAPERVLQGACHTEDCTARDAAAKWIVGGMGDGKVNDLITFVERD